MRLIDIVLGPWAVTPDMLTEIQEIYSRHMRGDKIDIKEVEARIGAPLNNARRDYVVDRGSAIIPVEGILAKRANLFMQISGGTSTQILAGQVQTALDDPTVERIILHVDSPGGTVDGTQEVADVIHSARGRKPILALADGMMASAAYWIGSCADKVFISSDTTAVGSIGVVTRHMDVSGAEAQRGIKTTEISAGKYKRIDSSYAPLSQEGRDYIQERLDHIYSVFVEAVARNRDVAVETVLEDMAEGRVFIGRQAIKAGLVDGVSTLDALIDRAAAGEFDRPDATRARDAGAAPAADAQPQEIEVMELTVEKIKADHPALAAALIEEGRVAGAASERQRIQDVEAQTLPGHDALIQALKFDGKTSGAEAAVAVLGAEKAKRGQMLANLQADANETREVPAAPAPAAEAVDPSAPIEDRAKASWDKSPSLRDEFGGNFNAYLAVARAEEAGRVRIKSAAK